jgi:hypothetical protein
MVVQRETTYKGQPVFRLAGINGEAVVAGNSGAGVLLENKLIGNMWGTVMLEEMTSSGPGTPQQTSFSIAAQLPAEISAH